LEEPPPAPAVEPEAEPPVTSPSGRLVARATAAAMGRKAHLFVGRKDAISPELVVDAARATPIGAPPGAAKLADTATFSAIAFSHDEHLVYFLSDGWATSAALYSVDLATKDVRFLKDSTGYQVIAGCKDAKLEGDLVISRHVYDFASVRDWTFLADPTGNDAAILGPEERATAFLSQHCDGKRAPSPPIPSVPARLRGKLVCKEFVLEFAPIPLADGALFPSFIYKPVAPGDVGGRVGLDMALGFADGCNA